MPQLTMNKSDTPKRISVTLQWDEKRDAWSLGLTCWSQSERVQIAQQHTIDKDFDHDLVGSIVGRTVVAWINAAPASALAHMLSGVSMINQS